jgi:hypothetical protein
MRGVGATCTAQTTHGRPKRMALAAAAPGRPECCKPEIGTVLMSAASSPFRQNGDSRLAATCCSGSHEQIDGLSWPRASLCIDTQDQLIRAKRRVVRHPSPGDRQAPIFRQESEGGIQRRIRRQPGGESGWRWSLGMEPPGRAAASATYMERDLAAHTTA